MFDKNGYDRLLRCSTSSECMSVLQEQGYFKDSAMTGDILDPASWQRLFDAKMSALTKKLVGLSPDDCASLLSEIDRQYRLESLKSGLRLMVTNVGDDLQSYSVLGDLEDDTLRSAAETRNLERLFEAAGAPFLYYEVSSVMAGKNPVPLAEAIIDRCILARIWDATGMRDWMDKESVQGLVGEQIDAINLLVVARSKALGISAEELHALLVPVNYRLGDALTEAVNAGSAANALRAFAKTVYSDPLNVFLDAYKEKDSLQPLDVLLRRRHASSCLSAFTGFPFCAGLPLAFAYLMNYEISDLRAILFGKRDDLPIERIEHLLVLRKVL